jgi:hypothetical protein
MKRFAAVRAVVVRLLLVIYVPLVVLGAYPFPETPLIGPAGVFARKSLARLSVSPGLQVFPGVSNDIASTSKCIRITGESQEGVWSVLYQNDCPPKSNWHVVRHQLVHHHFMGMNIAKVLRNWKKLPRRPKEPLRRMVALGDLACHSREFGPEPRKQARLEVSEKLRNVRDGRHLTAEMRCRYECQADALALPQCKPEPRNRVQPSGAE